MNKAFKLEFEKRGWKIESYGVCVTDDEMIARKIIGLLNSKENG